MPRTNSSRRHLATLVLAVAGGAQAPAAPPPLDTRACQVSTAREAEQRRPGPQQQAYQAPNDIQEAISDMADPGISQAVELMESYAQRTGLTTDQAPRRYLWTDAFAVCNFIGLARATGDQRFLQLALRLVAQTHHSLGRHRDDDPRSGWISGLAADDGEAHPTLGGLRIGKALPERRADEPLDERLEWERDGQYFHYLTKWMHALDQLGRATHDPRFNRWASELAITARRAFVYQSSDSGTAAMHWKMSIDLTEPRVPVMGQHDPLDGYVTIMQLHASAAEIAGEDDAADDLDRAARQFAPMLAATQLTTSDPLGIGGLLVDAHRVVQLMRAGALPRDGLLERLLDAALEGLHSYARSGELQAPAHYRLAFRELGLAIGLHAVQRMSHPHVLGPGLLSPTARRQLKELSHYVPLASRIESFWRQPAQQRVASWVEHRDINEVMLATSLAPEGFLVLDLCD